MTWAQYFEWGIARDEAKAACRANGAPTESTNAEPTEFERFLQHGRQRDCLGTSETFSQVNQAQTYVSLSRARRSMHLVTNSKAALREAVTRKSERLSALEWAMPLIEATLAKRTLDLQQRHAWEEFAKTRDRTPEAMQRER